MQLLVFLGNVVFFCSMEAGPKVQVPNPCPKVPVYSHFGICFLTHTKKKDTKMFWTGDTPEPGTCDITTSVNGAKTGHG